MFGCCKRLALDIYNIEYNPNILVADSAKSITRGFQKVFDLIVGSFPAFVLASPAHKYSMENMNIFFTLYQVSFASESNAFSTELCLLI